MADLPSTPEGVALALLERIAAAEDWTGFGQAANTGNPWKKKRGEILDAYDECLKAAHGQRARPH